MPNKAVNGTPSAPVTFDVSNLRLHMFTDAIRRDNMHTLIQTVIFYVGYVLLVSFLLSLGIGPIALLVIIAATFIGLRFLPKSNNMDAQCPNLEHSNSVFYNDYARGVFWFQLVQYTILLGSNELRTIGQCLKARSALTPANAPAIDSFYAKIQAKGTSPRFHPRSDFVLSDDIVETLLKAKAIWAKSGESGELLIGLNRKYDQIAN